MEHPATEIGEIQRLMNRKVEATVQGESSDEACAALSADCGL
jgi:hypothetical protein